MAIHTELCGSIVRVTLIGDYVWSEIEATAREVLGDPALKPGFHMLVDVRAAQAAPSSRVISERAEWMAEWTERLLGRCAIVVDGPLQFGLSRMFVAICEALSLRVNVFESVADAERWLEEP